MTSEDVVPNVIGEGSYGCVHKPPMKCINKTRKSNKNISKLMTDSNVNKELKEYKLINAADKKQEVYLGKPSKCKVGRVLTNIKAISKCSSDHFKAEMIDQYSLILMKYGGQNLEQFGDEVSTWTKVSSNIDNIELFWIECIRLFYGLKLFHDNGIVHHDLKHQNIVYDQKTNRVNFIDFGFMTKKSTIIDSVSKSKYWLGEKHHWSFPLENIYWNKNIYLSWANKKYDTAMAYTEFRESVSNSCSYFFTSILPANTTKTNKLTLMDRACTKAFANVIEFEPETYTRFITQSIDTIDVYGLGIALMYVLVRSKHLLTISFAAVLHDMLIVDMLNPNLYLRIKPDQLLAKYEDLLIHSGLLTKHNKHIENHLILDGQSKILTTLGEINRSDGLSIPSKLSSANIEIAKECPDGKEYNPVTKRCVKVCKPGYVRNPDLKCVRDKTRKIKYKTCPSGKQFNPLTNRCVKDCKSGYTRDERFKCKKMSSSFVKAMVSM
jgi:serine/threonine protein kinase